jgi:hypothetical protein
VIDRGHVRKRSKKPSKKYRDQFGHTPLSMEEEIPWTCRTLVIGVPLGPGNVSETGTPASNTSIRTGLDRNFDFALWHLCEYTPTQTAQDNGSFGASHAI